MELDPLVLTHKPRDSANTMLERRVLIIDRRQTLEFKLMVLV